MFNFVKNYLTKREGKSEYEHTLNKFLSDGKLDNGEKKELEELSKKYNLTNKDLIDLKKRYTSLTFKNICKDQRITEDEKKELESIMSYFDLSQDDFDFSQKNFNKFYSLALIDKGILPTPQFTGFDVILKKGEIVHWLCPSILKKFKKVTRTINYSGFSGSIKIVKGLRYRVGSINLSPQVSTVVVDEDSGNFWLTNQRLGFLGGRKSFALPYNKIMSFELFNDAIIIHKEGRENPYIIGLEDIELPAAVLSKILNQE